jgi:hypothetical protein
MQRNQSTLACVLGRSHLRHLLMYRRKMVYQYLFFGEVVACHSMQTHSLKVDQKRVQNNLFLTGIVNASAHLSLRYDEPTCEL